MGEIWFDYVILHKKFWTYGWTVKRLNKVKEFILNDSDIMFDLLERHNCKNIKPELMELNDKQTFLHAIGNFVCNIHYKMMNLKIIKG